MTQKNDFSKVFNFCNKFKIKVHGPLSLLERIASNLEVNEPETSYADAVIRINSPEIYDTIIKDKRFPYQRTIINSLEKSIEYYRYNTFVRKIRMLSNEEYVVDINVENDETAGLICFRNYCNNHPEMKNLPLVHSSLVKLGNEGILIAGETRSGKTTLMLYLMQHLGANLISEDNIYLEKDMTGLYFPKVPRIRFRTAQDSCLSTFLTNIESTDATQYWDVESIKDVVREGNFDIDGGIAISKKKLAQTCGVKTAESCKIAKIIFPSYSTKGIKYDKIPREKGFRLLEKIGVEKKTAFDPEPLNQQTINLKDYEREGVDFYTLSYSGFKELQDKRFSL